MNNERVIGGSNNDNKNKADADRGDVAGKPQTTNPMPNLQGSVITFIYNPSTWTKNPVTVTITDTQAESHTNGLHLEYCENSSIGTWEDVPAGGNINGDHNEAINVRLSDGQNNGTTYATGNVTNIDTTAPTVTNISANNPTSSSITVTLNAHDEDSGIKTINWMYQKNGNDTWTTETEHKTGTPSDSKGTGDKGTSFTHTFNNLAEGTKYTFKATVTDASDNTTAGTQTATATTQTTGITPTKDNYGEYVDYGIDINGNNDKTDDWRVFYVGQEGDGQAKDRIFLIAADYVASTCAELTAAISNSGMRKHDNRDYESYDWNSPPGYHCNDGRNKQSSNTEAQCSFPDLFMPENTYCDGLHRYFCSDHTRNANSLCASRLQCTEDWNTFAKEGYAAYAIGGPTLNMWVESWNTNHGNERTLYANGQSSSYGYYVGTSESDTPGYQNLKYYTGYGDTLYFPHQSYQNDLDNDQKEETCYGYWLASPTAVGEDLRLMYVYCFGGIYNYAYNNGDRCGARPVVCLQADARLKDNEKVNQQNKKVYDIIL